MSLDFEGKEIMIDKISMAVDQKCPRDITDSLRNALIELVPNEDVCLPDCVFQFDPGHYCRRLIHQDDRLGYTILAMTWAPGQATPIHDHAGMWCVEAVWSGEIEVVQFELVDQAADRYALEPRSTMRTGVGSAGSLIPPHEYHTIANPCADKAAVTIHIYAGEMDHCCVFEPIHGDWYQRQSKALSLDVA